MKITYWVSTMIVCIFLLLSAYTYLFHDVTIKGVKALGFPEFFIAQLAILKIMAIVVILKPNLPIRYKDWAYAGVMYFLITALVAHIAHKDSGGIIIMLIVLMAILLTSYITLLKRVKN